MSDGTRRLGLLVARISGTAQLDRLGDAEAHHAVERRLHRIERAGAAFRGRVLDTFDDQIAIAFDSAEAAFHAACEMQQRIATLPPVSGVTLAICVGFNLGLAIDREGDSRAGAVDIVARLAGHAKAGQTLTNAETIAALPETLRTHASMLRDAPPRDESLGDIYEVVWAHVDASRALRAAGAAQAKRGALRLRLRLGDQEMVLGPRQPTATLGRDANADIITMDNRASRTHGRIEFRRDKYVLIDQSTNGTYLTFAGESEIVLKREEAILTGRGHVCFGHASTDADAELLSFEVLG